MLHLADSCVSNAIDVSKCCLSNFPADQWILENKFLFRKSLGTISFVNQFRFVISSEFLLTVKSFASHITCQDYYRKRRRTQDDVETIPMIMDGIVNYDLMSMIILELDETIERITV